jgi:uncharacterized protein YgiM (DUF1202 family)
LLLVFSFSAAANIHAAVNNPDPHYKLHLREEPNKNSESLGLYYNGVDVDILEDGADGWVHVRIGNYTGYMQKEYLATGAAASQVKSASPLVEVMNASPSAWLNLREWPNVDSEAIGHYMNGTEVEVLAVDLVWYHVRLDGITGFMMAEHLSPVEEAPIGLQASVVRIPPKSDPSLPASSAPSASTFNGVREALINISPGERLSLLAEPAADAAVLGDFYSGTDIEILEKAAGAFVKVRIGYDREGAVLEGYMPFDRLAQAYGNNAKAVRFDLPSYTAFGEMPLMREPGADAEVIKTFGAGTYYEVFGIVGDWCLVCMEGYIGYLPAFG